MSGIAAIIRCPGGAILRATIFAPAFKPAARVVFFATPSPLTNKRRLLVSYAAMGLAISRTASGRRIRLWIDPATGALLGS